MNKNKIKALGISLVLFFSMLMAFPVITFADGQFSSDTKTVDIVTDRSGLEISTDSGTIIFWSVSEFNDKNNDDLCDTHEIIRSYYLGIEYLEAEGLADRPLVKFYFARYKFDRAKIEFKIYLDDSVVRISIKLIDFTKEANWYKFAVFFTLDNSGSQQLIDGNSLTIQLPYETVPEKKTLWEQIIEFFRSIFPFLSKIQKKTNDGLWN